MSERETGGITAVVEGDEIGLSTKDKVRQKPVVGYLTAELGNDPEGIILTLLRDVGLVDEEKVPTIHIPPLPHRGSEALYLAEYYYGNDKVFVSFLLPYSETSSHFHEDPMFEWYFPISGGLYLRNSSHDNDEGKLVVMRGTRVGPYFNHQAVTKEQTAITLIVLRNALLVPESRHHISTQVSTQRG